MDYLPYDGQKMARKTLLLTHQVNTKRCWLLKSKNQQFGDEYATRSTRKNKPYKKLAKEKRTARMMMLVLGSDTGPIGWYSCSCCGERQYIFDDKGLENIYDCDTLTVTDLPT